tara:strand:- start:3509 stop:3838 length:330 start_codon:yes stop_codon:yes gene_type:complete
VGQGTEWKGKQKAPHYTVMYQIWMRPGSEANLKYVWCHREEQLSEIGVVGSWVRVKEAGRCEAFLVWQSQSHWEEANQFYNFIGEVFQALDQTVLGWCSPVATDKTGDL